MMNKIFYLILGLLSIVLISCENNIITTTNKTVKYYTIVKIENMYKDSILCKYHFDTYINYAYYKNSGTFMDTIGKYKVTDQVKVEFIKKNNQND